MATETKEQKRRRLLKELNELESESEVKEAAEEVLEKGGTEAEAKEAATKEAVSQGLSREDAKLIAGYMVDDLEERGYLSKEAEDEEGKGGKQGEDESEGGSEAEAKGSEKNGKDEAPVSTHRWYR
jgi:hypothetical protein